MASGKPASKQASSKKNQTSHVRRAVRSGKEIGAVDRRLPKDKPFVVEEITDAKKKIRLVDLFAGIGGFHYGVGASAARQGLGVKTVLVSEIEPSCQQTYRANHHCEVQGDINSVDFTDVARGADIVTAGFPCQPFSNSGLKLGLSDPRGQFFFRIREIIEAYGAKAFILENVPGIRKNGGGKFPSQLAEVPQFVGRTMHFLEEQLLQMKDYHIRWAEIDSSKLASPQVRKRVYIVGLHRDLGDQVSLALKEYQPNPFIKVVQREIIPSLELSERQEANLRSFMSEPPSYTDGMRRVGNAYLCAGGNVGQGYHAFGMVPTLTKVWARFLPIYFPHERENVPEVGSRDFQPNRYYGKGYFRRASVREVMRLQGFPDTFEPHDSQNLAYEHAGNAVNAKIVREIVDQLIPYI
jgi:DNA (cytosine-5)-methyltransferase 1